MAIVVELLTRGGVSLKHYVFDRPKITIGRSFDNDVHLDDPFVDPHHLQIEHNADQQQLYFNDCQSLNGTRKNGRISLSGMLDKKDELKLGRSRIRVFCTGGDIAPTMKLSAMEEKTEWLGNVSLAVGLGLLFALVSLYGDFLQSFKDFKLFQQVPKVFGQMLILSAWPLGFALLSKLNRKEARLVTQFNLLWLFLLLLTLLAGTEKVIRFNLPASDGLDIFMLCMFALLMWAFVWFCLFIAFHQPDRKRRFIASGVVLLVCLPVWFYLAYQKDNFSSRPSYNKVLMPPAFLLNRPASTQEFLQDTQGLFDKVAADAAKQN